MAEIKEIPVVDWSIMPEETFRFIGAKRSVINYVRKEYNYTGSDHSLTRWLNIAFNHDLLDEWQTANDPQMAVVMLHLSMVDDKFRNKCFASDKFNTFYHANIKKFFNLIKDPETRSILDTFQINVVCIEDQIVSQISAMIKNGEESDAYSLIMAYIYADKDIEEDLQFRYKLSRATGSEEHYERCVAKLNMEEIDKIDIINARDDQKLKMEKEIMFYNYLDRLSWKD